MRLLRPLRSGLLIAATAFPLTVLAQAGGGFPQRQGGIDLLAPLGALRNITVTRGFGTFLTYFNDAAKWIIYVAMGICVLWVLLGGFMLMMPSSSYREKGKDHMKWALIGLVILLFAGVILRTLNSLFFK
jgi:hypothetical protein